MSKFNLREAEGEEAMGAAAPAPAAPAPEAGVDGEDVVITLKGLKDVDADSLNVDVRVDDDSEEEAGEPEGEEAAGEDLFGSDEGGEEEAAAEDTKMESKKSRKGDIVLEISKAELKKELNRMRRQLSESDSDVGKRVAQGGKVPVDDFGGGKDDGDPWLDHDVTTKDNIKESWMDEMEMEDEIQLKSKENRFGSKAANAHGTVVELGESDDEMDECQMDESDDEMDEADEMDGSDDEMDESDEMDEADEMDESDELDESKARRKLVAARKVQAESAKKISALTALAKKHRGTVREGKLKKLIAVQMKTLKEARTVVAKLTKVLKEGSKNGSSVSKLVKENKELKSKLDEVILYSQKLLYLNKLMQTEGYSTSKRSGIIDALDKAQSLREAKALYTQLSESLKSKRETVNESARPKARVVGSGSRVGQTTGAKNLNESAGHGADVEVDRWSTLAGIKG